MKSDENQLVSGEHDHEEDEEEDGEEERGDPQVKGKTNQSLLNEEVECATDMLKGCHEKFSDRNSNRP